MNVFKMCSICKVQQPVENYVINRTMNGNRLNICKKCEKIKRESKEKTKPGYFEHDPEPWFRGGQ